VHGSTHQDDALRNVMKMKSDGVEMVKDWDRKRKRRCSGDELARE
jgi:hypothetical protein